MFEQFTILMMLILQLNAIIIMYELLRRKKRFAVSSCICLQKKSIQRQKFLKTRHLLRKSRSARVAPGSTASGGVTLKQKVSQKPGGK